MTCQKKRLKLEDLLQQKVLINMGQEHFTQENFIYEAAVLAHLSYEDQLRNDLLPRPEVEYKEFSYEGTHGFILEGENQLSISIEGTQTLKDWLSNIFFENDWLPDFISTNDPNTKVHTGFKLKAMTLKDNLSFRINRAAEEGKILHLAGHSSGGATASFLAQMILEKIPKARIFLYTFGSPKLGSISIYQELFKKCECCLFLANEKDIVTMLPWSYPSNPYQIKFDFEGNRWIQPLKSHTITTYVSVAKNLSIDET